MFTGTVPGSWSDMLRLQDLELDYNCGVCGALPSFSSQVLFYLAAMQRSSLTPFVGCNV